MVSTHPRSATLATCVVGLLLLASPARGQSGGGDTDDAQTEAKSDQSDDGPKTSKDAAVVEGPEAFQYMIAEDSLTVKKDGESVSSFRIPCNDSAAASESTLFVACGDERVMTLTLDDPADPDPTGIKRLGKRIARLYGVKGQVWVEFADGEAGPIRNQLDQGEGSEKDRSKKEGRRATDSETPISAPQSTEGDDGSDSSEEKAKGGEKSESDGDEKDESTGKDEKGRASKDEKSEDSKSEPLGRVIKVEPGYVVVDAGGDDGLEQGDALRFFAVRQEKLAGETASTYEEEVGVGRTVAVGQTRSRVELKMNDRVPEGSLVRPAENIDMEPGTSVDRVGGLFVAEGAARPFLPINSFGVGALIDAKLSYYFDANVAVEWSLVPFGFTATDSDNDVISFASNVIGSYDTQFVQVGLGLGVARLQGFDVFTTLSAIQKIRLGTRDGGHFTGTTNFVLSQDGWEFGGIRMKVLAPFWSVLPKTWSMVRFQSGVPGQTFIETGLRIMTSGNGTEGSTFVTPLLGYGFIRSVRPDRDVERFENQTVTYGGPLVGIEVEKRF